MKNFWRKNFLAEEKDLIERDRSMRFVGPGFFYEKTPSGLLIPSLMFFQHGVNFAEPQIQSTMLSVEELAGAIFCVKLEKICFWLFLEIIFSCSHFFSSLSCSSEDISKLSNGEIINAMLLHS